MPLMDAKRWASLVQSGEIENLKIPELKAYCKEVGLGQGGEKELLVCRIRDHVDGAQLLLKDGRNPAELKGKDLTKVCAGFGLNVIGNADELRTGLLEHLRSSKSKSPSKGHVEPESPTKGRSRSESPAKSSKSAAADSGVVDAEVVAKEVLRLGQAGDYDGILNVLGGGVTSQSSASVIRKAYLKISLLIHPDRLKSFADAKQAFQALVHAYERTRTPPAAQTQLKQKALARSNENCFQTVVKCPRCQVQWGMKVEGNPEYFYNFMMQGIRSFTCSTCLLSFGCLSATHECQWCHRPFEYHPDDYHRQIKCGHKGCNLSFGFMMYQVSERALKAAREGLQEEVARQMKNDTAKSSRADRAARRAGGPLSDKEAEAAFLRGLSDVCPRCGMGFEDIAEGEQFQHLRSCNDQSKHAQYRELQRLNAKNQAAKAEKAQKQRDASSSAAWSFLGGNAGQLWMLPVEQLCKLCEQEGLPSKGAPGVLIARLQEKLRERKQLTDDPGSTVPEGLQGMNVEQIKKVAAAHGVCPAGSKRDLVKALETLRRGETLPEAIQGPGAKFAIKDKKYLMRNGSKVTRKDDDSDFDDIGSPGKQTRSQPMKRRKVI